MTPGFQPWPTIGMVVNFTELRETNLGSIDSKKRKAKNKQTKKQKRKARAVFGLVSLISEWKCLVGTQKYKSRGQNWR